MKEYGRRLLNTNVTDELLEDCRHIRLPLHVLPILACAGKWPSRDVELILDNLPPRMAKCALEMKEGIITGDIYVRFISLDIAAQAAPRSLTNRMVSLTPNAARI